MEYRERDIKPRYIGVDNVVVSISGAVRLEYSWSETSQVRMMIWTIRNQSNLRFIDQEGCEFNTCSPFLFSVLLPNWTHAPDLPVGQLTSKKSRLGQKYPFSFLPF